MLARFLLGPAGSGKTRRCLDDVRAALARSPEGRPLVFLSPKQATFQIERQLLAHPALRGFSRLRILSFERLADFVLESLGQPAADLLSEEGRVMVLRSLLARHQDQLRLFRASARLPGFARELSRTLRLLQRHRLSAQQLLQPPTDLAADAALTDKLHDLGVLLDAYQSWLREHQLRDAEALLDLATAALRRTPPGSFGEIVRSQEALDNPHVSGTPLTRPTGTLSPQGGEREGDPSQSERGNIITPGSAETAPWIEALWLDGFAEITPQELDLLAALTGHCQEATLAFCLDQRPTGAPPSWRSLWAATSSLFHRCHQHLSGLEHVTCQIEHLARHPQRSRFGSNPTLARLEHLLAGEDAPAANASPDAPADEPVADTLRLALCPHPEAEAVLAARELLRFVQGGGRFREAAVLVRQLEGYAAVLRRVFTRYGIPFFLDQREPAAHHPLAELTRNALRVAAWGWRTEDWFGALKTGLVHDAEEDVDWLENEALARGWEGRVWLEPLTKDGGPFPHAEALRLQWVPPFTEFAERTRQPLTGPQLADAIQTLWSRVDAARRLERWESAAADLPASSAPLHTTVWRQMQDWLDNLALAFDTTAFSLHEWLPIIEAGLGSLTVGAVPPALDQVLIGAVDRSRNPDLQLALLLGLNESVFPAPPTTPGLFSDADLARLGSRGFDLGLEVRRQLGREQYLAYIALTRARRRLVLTCAARDLDGRTLNVSPILTRLQRLFPGLPLETVNGPPAPADSLHPSELLGPLLAARHSSAPDASPLPAGLAEVAGVPSLWQGLPRFHIGQPGETLAPELADPLFGPTLRTSISRLETFAACPFQHFAASGLRAEERKQWLLDPREQGTWLHEILHRFHQQTAAENRRWRDLAPAEARDRLHQIIAALAPSFRDGLMQRHGRHRLIAESLGETAWDFLQTQLEWFAQYRFDPAASELKFGPSHRDPDAPESPALPALVYPLDERHLLEIRGTIDRVDLADAGVPGERLVLVLDYKSSKRVLKPIELEHGLKLQLPTYLAVLRRVETQGVFPGFRLRPAGMFFVTPKGNPPAKTKASASAGWLVPADTQQQARRESFKHFGRFDVSALPFLDSRNANAGDQFHYTRNKDGTMRKTCKDPMPPEAFLGLLEHIESLLQQFGRRIYQGEAGVNPWRLGNKTACESCRFLAVCRLDPWTHPYRTLRATPDEAPEETP